MRIAVLSFSPLGRDSRVLRTARTLSEAGHDVLLVGYGPAPEGAPYGVALLPDLPSPAMIRAGIVLRQAPATLLPISAPALYWMSAARQAARRIIEAYRPDVVHANDWNSLPVAGRVKRLHGSRIVYDSHEMATAEYEENLKWRLAALAHVRTLEKRGIARADAVITVSPGIAKALAELYPGCPAPVVVRNVPDAAPAPFRPTGETVQLLFHGLIRPNRGVEPLIDALPALRPEFRLMLRGGSLPPYRAGLEARAAALGVADRITFEDSVPPDRVVEAASHADLGVVVLPDTSRHNRFALPNKLFEYIAAGLGVVISDLPDMTDIVRPAGCGVFAEPEAGSITRALNGLDRAGVDTLKRSAAAAAPGLVWSVERERLLSVYRGLSQGGARESA